MKHCDLPAILARAAAAARVVDVQGSSGVTIHADDVYKIGDVTQGDVPALVAEIEALRAGLDEAIGLFGDASQYKGEFLASKHGDAEDIARLRVLLPPTTETPDAE